jgi:hypothetical protein
MPEKFEGIPRPQEGSDFDTKFSIKEPEHSKLELKFSNSDLKEIFGNKQFSPERLILLLERQYPSTYRQDVGVWEGYTLKKHTLMVMGQFEKYFGDKDLPSGIDKNIFRLFLALHDVGKPEAISRGGKHLQYEYTRQYIQSLFEALGIDQRHTDLALVLASGDPIGKYLTSRMDTIQTRTAIEQMANEAKMSVNEFFELLCIYYKLDAGSYTENAGGLRSLDDLFEFDEINRNLNFAPHVQSRINQLGFKK